MRITVFVCLIVAAAFQVAVASPVSRPADEALVRGIAGDTLVAISDGDFVAQTYATGRLAPREAGHQDLLTVISKRAGTVASASLPLSNSVTAAPEILALASDGRAAFVVERLGPRPPQGETVRDLPAGEKLYAVDLSDPQRPRVSDTARVDVYPEALAVSPDGKWIAVVSNTPVSSVVQLVPYSNGRLGTMARFDLASLGITGDASTPRGGVTATNVQWHPSGRYLAVNINTQNRIAFFELTDRDGMAELKPWGNTVSVGADPFVGRYTPDGRYYLTSDWGRDFAASDLAGRVPDRPSAISVIRLADVGTPTHAARHERIGGTATDVAAEGLAVSPDGRLVATINMRGTAFPPQTRRFDRYATVTLLTLDAETGQVTKVADYPLDGVLPEGGTFDRTGNRFLATVFQGHEGAGPDGGPGIEVFSVVKGNTPALERLGRIPMPHGVHHVDVAR